MRRKSGNAWLATSLAALCMVMLGTRVHAQSAAIIGESPWVPCPSQLRGGSLDPAREEVRSERLVGVAAALDVEQSATQAPRRRDSVLNGVLIGAGVGALLGLIPDYYDDCEECHDSLYASIAVGAGIGLIVDLLRTDTRAVSQSRSDGGFRMGVAAGRRAVGVRGMVRWR